MNRPATPVAVIYRAMTAGEEQQVCDVVVRVFTKFVAPPYSTEGIHEFLTYAADPGKLRDRCSVNHFVLVAEIQGQIAGAIEVRNNDHISLFFVDSDVRRAGIGRGLWHRALDSCLARRPDVARIIVHSLPNAADAYRKFGFQAYGSEQTVNGIPFMPMAFAVTKAAGN